MVLWSTYFLCYLPYEADISRAVGLNRIILSSLKMQINMQKFTVLK